MEETLILENYGVKLKLLTHDKIEQLRQWRNDPKIQQYMFYREEITPEMQERWYAKLDKKSNLYFFIEYDGKEIGVINIKDIDFVKGCGESGIFIYDDYYLCSDISYRAHLVMFEYAYNQLGLKYMYSHIQESNSVAERFCKFLGGVKDDLQSKDGCHFFTITSTNFENNINRKRFVKKFEMMS